MVPGMAAVMGGAAMKIRIHHHPTQHIRDRSDAMALLNLSLIKYYKHVDLHYGGGAGRNTGDLYGDGYGDGDFYGLCDGDGASDPEPGAWDEPDNVVAQLTMVSP
jgi:hypothetical protein